jgi:hypothetical protein
MRNTILLAAAAVTLAAFQVPPAPDSPDAQPSPTPTPTLSPTPSPAPSPTPAPDATPTPTPTPPASAPIDAHDQDVTEGDDQPPKGRSRHHLRT